MKPRPAKLVSCTQGPIPLDDGKTVTMWIVKDSTGKRFAAPTEKEAQRMFAEYYQPRRKS